MVYFYFLNIEARIQCLSKDFEVRLEDKILNVFIIGIS